MKQTTKFSAKNQTFLERFRDLFNEKALDTLQCLKKPKLVPVRFGWVYVIHFGNKIETPSIRPTQYFPCSGIFW